MKIKRADEKLIFWLAFLFSSGIFLARLESYMALNLEKARAPSKLLSSFSPSLQSRESIQGVVEQIAGASGIKRLLTVGTLAGRPDESVELEWEGTVASSFRFLDRLYRDGQLARCEKFRVTIGDG